MPNRRQPHRATTGLVDLTRADGHSLIKKIKRVGHGFRNFANYRLRLLLPCGVDWRTQLATPIRGRLHAS